MFGMLYSIKGLVAALGSKVSHNLLTNNLASEIIISVAEIGNKSCQELRTKHLL
jgi:hypothetical protein